jgi:hypothetical protein
LREIFRPLLLVGGPSGAAEHTLSRSRGPNCSATTLDEALTAARQVRDEHHRARVLAVVAAQLGPGGCEKALEEALVSARLGNEWSRADALRALADQLPPDSAGLGDRIWSEALRLAVPSARAGVLSILAAKRDVSTLAPFAESLLATIDTPEAIGILRVLADRWLEFCRSRNTTPADELGLWLEHLRRAKRPHLINALAAVTPAIEIVGGQVALSEVVQAIVDSGLWWP